MMTLKASAQRILQVLEPLLYTNLNSANAHYLKLVQVEFHLLLAAQTSIKTIWSSPTSLTVLISKTNSVVIKLGQITVFFIFKSLINTSIQ